MSDTTDATTAPTVRTVDEFIRDHGDRLARAAAIPNGDLVIVTEVQSVTTMHRVGQIGKLVTRDSEDQSSTFNVHLLVGRNAGTNAWVADIRKATPDDVAEALQAGRRSADERVDEVKRQIGLKAMELAREHDWCDTVKRALEELDVPVPTRDVEMTVKFTWRGLELTKVTDLDNLRRSLVNERAVHLDGDWDPEEDDDEKIEPDVEVLDAKVLSVG